MPPEAEGVLDAEAFERALERGEMIPPGWTWVSKGVKADPWTVGDPRFEEVRLEQEDGLGDLLREAMALLRSFDGEQRVEELERVHEQVTHAIWLAIDLVADFLANAYPRWTDEVLLARAATADGATVEVPRVPDEVSLGSLRALDERARRVYRWLQQQLHEQAMVPMVRQETDGKRLPPRIAFLRVIAVLDLLVARLWDAATDGTTPNLD